jgi:hypothetical protein
MTVPKVDGPGKANVRLTCPFPNWELENNGHELPEEPAVALSANGQRPSDRALESFWEDNRQGILGIDQQGRCTLINARGGGNAWH